jgi:hypothetical protein
MSKPTTEESREIAGDIDEDAIEGVLSFAAQADWMDPLAPNRMGVAVVHEYLSSGKPASFTAEEIFVACRLEGLVFSKTEIERMAERLISKTEGVMPDVCDTIKEISGKNGFEKKALGFAFQPKKKETNADEVDKNAPEPEDVPEWVGGALFYQQPPDRMIGPGLKEKTTDEFGQAFTTGGEVFVFEPENKRLRQLLAGIDISHSLK